MWRSLWKKRDMSCGVDTTSTEDFAECWEADECSFLSEIVDCTPPWFTYQIEDKEPLIKSEYPSHAIDIKDSNEVISKTHVFLEPARGCQMTDEVEEDIGHPKDKTKLTLPGQHISSKAIGVLKHYREDNSQKIDDPANADSKDLMYTVSPQLGHVGCIKRNQGGEKKLFQDILLKDIIERRNAKDTSELCPELIVYNNNSMFHKMELENNYIGNMVTAVTPECDSHMVETTTPQKCAANLKKIEEFVNEDSADLMHQVPSKWDCARCTEENFGEETEMFEDITEDIVEGNGATDTSESCPKLFAFDNNPTFRMIELQDYNMREMGTIVSPACHTDVAETIFPQECDVDLGNIITVSQDCNKQFIADDSIPIFVNELQCQPNT